MQGMHRTVAEHSIEYREQLRRYNYVTPTSYLELLNVFKFLLHEKRTEVGGLRSKLQFGLDTLASAGEDIARLQIDLRDKEPRLVETQKEVEVTMAQIAIDRRDAAVTKEIVEKQEADAAEKAAEVRFLSLSLARARSWLCAQHLRCRLRWPASHFHFAHHRAVL